ncbi:ankyrin repeat and SOCS box protein 2-like [Papaver somniferum]|uniref:ankyrin repeat and SOCS box protein 2-like n=1 Tax=Papaver somniferum TaxID=3469 RepID=UPI000E6F488D|nr:ankyrin repeat and SOCS box protein 2-like [Papaver somniferum]
MEAEIDVKDGSGKTPLFHAAMERRLDAVEYLLAMGANPEVLDDSNRSPLHYVAGRGHTDVIPLLLSKGINVDVIADMGSPLQYAATASKPDTVKVLLDHGANPNLVFHDTFTPLQASIGSQSWQCAEKLLKAGADPNLGGDGVKALIVAAEVGAIEIIKDEAGAAPNVTKTVRGTTQIIKLLVEAGADPNVTNIHGLKPIEIVATIGNHRGVEILFPVTSPVPSYVDWSVNGIMKHANSKEFENKMIRQIKESFLVAKSRGTSAFQRKDYWLALYWYTEALDMKARDAAVLSNRSLCYVYLKNGDLAFEDATQCILERPDWPKAHYRAGVALKMLKRLDEAASTFSSGLKLDPKNKELEDALSSAPGMALKANSNFQHLDLECALKLRSYEE